MKPKIYMHIASYNMKMWKFFDFSYFSFICFLYLTKSRKNINTIRYFKNFFKCSVIYYRVDGNSGH